ncbi:MAG: hypothetical protein ACE37F_01585 [Nannocystaceae bacterium]|nr:hypothetical protein [bacterium]
MDEQEDPVALLVEKLGQIFFRLKQASVMVRALGYSREREKMLLKGIAFSMTELDKTLIPLLRERPDLDLGGGRVRIPEDED